MMKTNQIIARIGHLVVIGLGLAALHTDSSLAYEQYRDPATDAGNCTTCHGAFTDNTSPKGSLFPSDNKHFMHRDGSAMGTACDLCHTVGDGRNPYVGSSNGTANNTGRGCSGCHGGPGLRAHHVAKGVSICLTSCHVAAPIAAENVKPPYYGTADTRADNSCNTIPVANTNENWTLGDFKGLDNDGNNLYDAADFTCSPYQILSILKEGNNARITWQTAGGRKDALQAAPVVTGSYLNVTSAFAIPGVGIVTNSYLEIGGGTNAARFYRLQFMP